VGHFEYALFVKFGHVDILDTLLTDWHIDMMIAVLLLLGVK